MNKENLENEIATIIKNDNGCETRFEYESVSNITNNGSTVVYEEEVRAMTLNPKTNESFLMFKATGITQEKALENILDYVKNHRVTYYSHTILWSNKRDNKMNTSYFYAKDAFEALTKFYHGKNREDYNVFEVKMNPIS